MTPIASVSGDMISVVLVIYCRDITQITQLKNKIPNCVDIMLCFRSASLFRLNISVDTTTNQYNVRKCDFAIYKEGRKRVIELETFVLTSRTMATIC